MQFRVLAFALFFLVSNQPASAQILCVKCLEAMNGDMQKCEAAIPPEVEPKDPSKPTDAEKAAAAAQMAAVKDCAKKAEAALAICRKNAGYP